MFSKTCTILDYGSRWIAILNGVILIGIGISLVALGDGPIYLLFTALGVFALYVGIWRPEIWQKPKSATDDRQR